MDSRALDINSQWLGVPVEDLMENAGAAIARHCKDYKNIAIVCGRGNNGGDGLVAARYLLEGGAHVSVFVLEGERSPLNDLNLSRLEQGVVRYIKDERDFSLDGYDLIVDALVGVGLEGELRAPLDKIVEKMNECDAKKISVDIPSGGHIEADSVISFHSAKVPGAIVEDIGIPPEAETFCGPGDVVVAIPKRKQNSKKGDFGRVLVVGGSKSYIGTPSLVGMSALRSGADLVHICTPQYVADHVFFSPNLIVHPTKSQDFIDMSDIDEILDIKSDAIIFGNGLGTKSDRAIQYLLEKTDRYVVLDAEAISHCKKEWLSELVVMTPHCGEYKTIFGRLENIEKDILEDSQQTGAVIVLKGGTDYISDGKVVRKNHSGSPYMTVGGSGDVLAGLLGGLLAQNKNPMVSATAATFLTGLAGEMSADEFGPSLCATDIIDYIPQAIKDCLEFER